MIFWDSGLFFLPLVPAVRRVTRDEPSTSFQLARQALRMPLLRGTAFVLLFMDPEQPVPLGLPGDNAATPILSFASLGAP